MSVLSCHSNGCANKHYHESFPTATEAHSHEHNPCLDQSAALCSGEQCLGQFAGK
jgi:hypothetical protein